MQEFLRGGGLTWDPVRPKLLALRAARLGLGTEVLGEAGQVHPDPTVLTGLALEGRTHRMGGCPQPSQAPPSPRALLGGSGPPSQNAADLNGEASADVALAGRLRVVAQDVLLQLQDAACVKGVLALPLQGEQRRARLSPGRSPGAQGSGVPARLPCSHLHQPLASHQALEQLLSLPLPQLLGLQLVGQVQDLRGGRKARLRHQDEVQLQEGARTAPRCLLMSLCPPTAPQSRLRQKVFLPSLPWAQLSRGAQGLWRTGLATCTAVSVVVPEPQKVASRLPPPAKALPW